MWLSWQVVLLLWLLRRFVGATALHPLVEAHKVASPQSLNRMLTTICLEISQSQEQPYFMCKGTELPRYQQTVYPPPSYAHTDNAQSFPVADVVSQSVPLTSSLNGFDTYQQPSPAAMQNFENLADQFFRGPPPTALGSPTTAFSETSSTYPARPLVGFPTAPTGSYNEQPPAQAQTEQRPMPPTTLPQTEKQSLDVLRSSHYRDTYTSSVAAPIAGQTVHYRDRSSGHAAGSVVDAPIAAAVATPYATATPVISSIADAPADVTATHASTARNGQSSTATLVGTVTEIGADAALSADPSAQVASGASQRAGIHRYFAASDPEWRERASPASRYSYRGLSDDEDGVYGMPNWDFSPEEFGNLRSMAAPGEPLPPPIRLQHQRTRQRTEFPQSRYYPAEHMNDPVMDAFFRSLPAGIPAEPQLSTARSYAPPLEFDEPCDSEIPPLTPVCSHCAVHQQYGAASADDPNYTASPTGQSSACRSCLLQRDYNFQPVFVALPCHNYATAQSPSPLPPPVLPYSSAVPYSSAASHPPLVGAATPTYVTAATTDYPLVGFANPLGLQGLGLFGLGLPPLGLRLPPPFGLGIGLNLLRPPLLGAANPNSAQTIQATPNTPVHYPFGLFRSLQPGMHTVHPQAIVGSPLTATDSSGTNASPLHTSAEKQDVQPPAFASLEVESKPADDANVLADGTTSLSPLNSSAADETSPIELEEESRKVYQSLMQAAKTFISESKTEEPVGNVALPAAVPHAQNDSKFKRNDYKAAAAARRKYVQQIRARDERGH